MEQPYEGQKLSTQEQERRTAYWKKNVSLITLFMSIWALVSLVAGILLVQPLNQITIGTIPLGFWFAQQGSIIVFVCLIFIYAKVMDGVDKEFGVSE